jgi:O-antigen ligase
LYAVRNPIFGLGPEGFRVAEGKSKPGLYAPAHNSYVAVACETGLPGFLLFMGGVVTSFITFVRIQRKSQHVSRANALTQAAFCMQLMMVMFCIAVGFLNFAYAEHFPLMVGISIAMAFAVRKWNALNLQKRKKAVNGSSEKEISQTSQICTAELVEIRRACAHSKRDKSIRFSVPRWQT